MRKTFKLPWQRDLAFHAIDNAGEGWEVEIREKKRSNPQNDRMWSMLRHVSENVEWYGDRLTPGEWKIVFTAAWKQEKIVPGINGGFVSVGVPTHKMTVEEMEELQTIITAFSAEHGITKWPWEPPQEI